MASLTPTSASLGNAAHFAILANQSITNTGPTTITNGDVGLYPNNNTSITGFGTVTMTGTIYAADSTAQDGQTDATTVYNQGVALSFTMDLTGIDLGTASPLIPGIYKFDSSAQLTGTLILNGPGIYVFQIGSTLTTASASQVLLTNGANSCDVFWLVGSSATLGTTTLFAGNIIAQDSDTLTTGVTLDGSVFALTGSVTLDTNTISNICVCFAKGTQIKTANGYVSIENLRAGDSIVTIGTIMDDYKKINMKYDDNNHPVQTLEKLKWIGHYKVNNPSRDTAPICIKKGANGDNIPNNDLYVSPKHVIVMNNKSNCALNLINGTTIYQDTSIPSIDYYHIRLDSHHVVLANGVPTESLAGEANQRSFISIK